jgi:hypothetical protein
VQNVNCVSNINLQVPGGFQVSLASVTTRGYAYLPPKVRARVTTQYFLAGSPIDIGLHSELVGPTTTRSSSTIRCRSSRRSGPPAARRRSSR